MTCCVIGSYIAYVDGGVGESDWATVGCLASCMSCLMKCVGVCVWMLEHAFLDRLVVPNAAAARYVCNR